ncbi:MAG: hypothetical protein ACOCP8_10275 [archaeon]
MIPKKEIHFFDLDHTLIDMKNNVWFIDKERPNIPIIKITPREFNLIKSNIYKKYNLKIDYNDYQFFISEEIFNKIRKRKNIPIERIGISFREYTDREFIETSEFDFLYNNIKHLNNSNAKICFLTARSDRYKHGNFTNKLREILKNLNLKLFKIYFVGRKHEVYHKEYISYRKSLILLEHLIGLKIKDNKFIPYKQDYFKKVYFYDDNVFNIDSANNIQNIFNEIYSNTEDNLKRRIMNVINKKPTLINNLIYPNELKPFERTTIILNSPIKYPIVIESFNNRIKRFNQFGSSK